MASHGVARTAGSSTRSVEARQKEFQQIAAYKELVDLVNTKAAEGEATMELLALTTKLLNENPEYYTVWNHRRRIIESLVLTEWKDVKDDRQKIQQLSHADLQLTFALLRRFPKCYWVWNHRNWTLQKAEMLLDADVARELWSGELELVRKMLQADNRNFHAWNYRRFVVAQLERLAGKESEPPSGAPSITESEFEYTTTMINKNLSNFSAWHNRSRLIPRLLRERKADGAARRKLLGAELRLICEAINIDPLDQSIWYYHQFLMSTLSPKVRDDDRIVLDLSDQERQHYYAHEIEYIQEILEDETDCKWIYEGLITIASYAREIEGFQPLVSDSKIRGWLDALRGLDPLRRGRWDDLKRSLNLV